jgi:hypothetical protein
MPQHTFRNFPRDFYRLFSYVNQEPRIPLAEIARRMGKDKRTISAWWKIAVENRIIIPPVLRKKSFLNFREHVYFLKVRDPSKLFDQLKDDRDITYYMVQTGFSNFGITSIGSIDPPGDVILSGEKSDYYISTPPDHSFEKAIAIIEKKLHSIGNPAPSPLLYHQRPYEPWDEKDEILYQEFCNDFRKPLTPVMRKHHVYSDKIMKWIRSSREFGQIITYYFPNGEAVYLPSIFMLNTDHDSLIIDIFSQLPLTNTYYRLGTYLIMTIHVPFQLRVKSLIRKALSRLQEDDIVETYDTSIIEYHYRP